MNGMQAIRNLRVLFQINPNPNPNPNQFRRQNKRMQCRVNWHHFDNGRISCRDFNVRYVHSNEPDT